MTQEKVPGWTDGMPHQAFAGVKPLPHLHLITAATLVTRTDFLCGNDIYSCYFAIPRNVYTSKHLRSSSIFVLCPAVPGCARLCPAVPGCARQCPAVPGSARLCPAVPGCRWGGV